MAERLSPSTYMNVAAMLDSRVSSEGPPLDGRSPYAVSVHAPTRAQTSQSDKHLGVALQCRKPFAMPSQHAQGHLLPSYKIAEFKQQVVCLHQPNRYILHAAWPTTATGMGRQERTRQIKAHGKAVAVTHVMLRTWESSCVIALHATCRLTIALLTTLLLPCMHRKTRTTWTPWSHRQRWWATTRCRARMTLTPVPCASQVAVRRAAHLGTHPLPWLAQAPVSGGFQNRPRCACTAIRCNDSSA